jgi:type I restriction enzyme S subunit
MLFDVIPSGWRATTLGGICQESGGDIQTGPFGSQLHASDYVETGIPSIMPANIKDGRISEEGIARVTPSDAERLSRYLVREGDIVYSRRGDVERCALVRHYQTGWLCGTGCLRVRPGSGVIESNFCAHFLSHPETREWISRHAIGATMPNLNTQILSAVPVLLPPSTEQKAIAHILGTLDDKIEVNRKANETLEAMARALFKSWFVDFDPVRAKSEGRSTGLPDAISDLFPDSLEEAELGEMPRGWQIAEIGFFVTVKKDSVDPSAFPAEVFDHYSIPAFDAGQLPAKELGSSIKSLKFLVGGEHLLISKLNPSIPRVWIPFSGSERRGICSTEFLVCETSSDYGRCFTYFLAGSDLTIEAMSGLAGGTSNSHQRIRPGDFLRLRFCVGDRAIRSLFNESVSSALRKGLELRQQSKCLASIRDVLLPKLISGELRIPDAERLLEEAGV